MIFSSTEKAIHFWADVFSLIKPKITMMAALLAACGSLLASGHFFKAGTFFSLLGIALLVAGSSAFNMYAERDTDALMERTKNRPLPSGRLSPALAFWFGLILSLLAVFCLGAFANPLTLGFGVFALLAYVLVYTPMKRLSSFSLFIGAIPGAMPVLLGYTAACNCLDKEGLALFSLAFFWQLPHFMAISIFRKEDYLRAGYPVLANTLGVAEAKQLLQITALALVLNSLLLWFLKVGGLFYGLSSLILGGWFLRESFREPALIEIESWAKRVFRASLYYQSLLFLALSLDVVLNQLL